MIEQNSLVTELEDVLKKNEILNKEVAIKQDLVKANDLYNKLLHDGLIKKRGNTLRSIDDSHLYYNTISR